MGVKMGRKSFTAEFKAKVAIEALKGNQTINELSSEFGVHSTQITTWKKNLIQAGKQAFSGKKQQGQRDQEDLMEKLYAQIGKQKVEIDWLKKKSGHLD